MKEKIIVTMNLMNITQDRNQSNVLADRNCGRSMYKGVYQCGSKYKAQIQIDRVQHYLGMFDSEAEAALAYDNHAKILLGQRARTNFVYNNATATHMVDSNYLKKLVDTQNFSISQMDEQKETKTLSLNRKRAYASMQNLPASFSSLQSEDVVGMALHPHRERNVVIRRRYNDISPLTTLIQSNVSKNTSTNTSIEGNGYPRDTSSSSISLVDDTLTTTSEEGYALPPTEQNNRVERSDDHIDSNLSDPAVCCLLQLRYLTPSTSTNPIRHTLHPNDHMYAEDANTITTLNMAAARASLAAATGADSAQLSIALPISTTTTTTSTPYQPATQLTAAPTAPINMTITKPSRNLTYWAGVLYIDPVSELQVWKGTYVECSDSTTRPTPIELIKSKNTFEYNTITNLNPAAGIQGIRSRLPVTLTNSYVLNPRAGTLLGSYLSNGTLQTDSHISVTFDLIKDINISYKCYKCSGTGVNLSGTFIMYGIYSTNSGVLEMKRQYI